MCVPGVHRDQIWVSDSLKLELQAVMSCHVVAMNQTQILCKSRECPLPLSHLANHQVYFNTLHSEGNQTNRVKNQSVYKFSANLRNYI